MKTISSVSTTMLVAVLFTAGAHGSTILEQQAADLAAQFISRLKPQLKQAMAEGGATRAVEICATQAPMIADALSAESGWSVRRVSLRQRNASRATPDAWERTILEQFDRRQAAGEAPADLHFGETRGGHYRYMQAQGVEGLCLVCHGESIAAPIAATLEKYYPDDHATGYSMGQVRGAISLQKDLSQ